MTLPVTFGVQMVLVAFSTFKALRYSGVPAPRLILVPMQIGSPRIIARYESNPNPVGPPRPVGGMAGQFETDTTSTATPGIASWAAVTSALFAPSVTISSRTRTRGGLVTGAA